MALYLDLALSANQISMNFWSEWWQEVESDATMGG